MSRGGAFPHKVLNDVAYSTEKWQLTGLERVDAPSAHCLFKCRSALYGDAILKIGKPGKETFTEYHALRAYGGRTFCRAFAADADRGILLEERIVPGTRLQEEARLEKRLSVFTCLFRGLHVEPEDTRLYPSYYGWVTRIADYMKGREDHRALYAHMEKAREMCRALTEAYPGKMLLHGDLHHDNILLGPDGEYRIIDPKGVVGDVIFDIPRFVLNEFWGTERLSFEGYRTKMDKIVAFLEDSLDVPAAIIRHCVYIETAIANCWFVEDGQKPDEEMVAYAEAILE